MPQNEIVHSYLSKEQILSEPIFFLEIALVAASKNLLKVLRGMSLHSFVKTSEDLLDWLSANHLEDRFMPLFVVVAEAILQPIFSFLYSFVIINTEAPNEAPKRRMSLLLFIKQRQYVSP